MINSPHACLNILLDTRIRSFNEAAANSHLCAYNYNSHVIVTHKNKEFDYKISGIGYCIGGLEIQFLLCSIYLTINTFVFYSLVSAKSHTPLRFMHNVFQINAPISLYLIQYTEIVSQKYIPKYFEALNLLSCFHI
jgi:hypothetical protein